MQTRPTALTDAQVAEAVSEGWGVATSTAAYLPVGFGSHHWRIEDATGTRWFASVDEVADDGHVGRLETALALAAAAARTGLAFVVAPLPSSDGGLLRRLPGGFALALYPHVEGTSGRFSDALSPAATGDLVRLLVALHAVPAPAGGDGWSLVDDREHLETAVARAAEAGRWPGPYGERLRALLREHGDAVTRALQRHDVLVEAAGDQRHRMVLTHGEPHPGNIIRTTTGPMLVDWDSARPAPPERDVWMLDARTHGAASALYAERSGRPLDPGLLSRYDLAWALADLGSYAQLLRTAAEETADTATAWDAFEGTLRSLA